MMEFINSLLENYLALIGGLIIAFSYLFQIYHLYKTKCTDGISIGFWCILILALSCLLINSITIFILYGTWGYMLAEILNVGLALVVLFMVLFYRKKEKEILLVEKQ